MTFESSTEIITHSLDGAVVAQRARDGYLNASAMCKVAGKLWADYRRQKNVGEFLDELSGSMGIPIDLIVVTTTVGPNDLRGTWVHPYVAVHLAQWLSPRFAVQVSKWVYKWTADFQRAANTFNRLVQMYSAQGRSEEWIRERIDGLVTRRELMNRWRDDGAFGRRQFGILTRMLHIRSIGIGPKEHRELKGLGPYDSLRDHCNELELLRIRLGERATVEVSRANDAKGYGPHKSAVLAGGNIAETARKQLEALIEAPIASPEKFLPKKDGPVALA